MTGIACMVCRATLPYGAKFCVECGAPAPLACAACGHLVASPVKFCPECGAKFVAADPAAREGSGSEHDAAVPLVERRQLTVLFCDLVGSTAMSTRLDPEDLREVIGAYHRCVADTVSALDGFVARYMGDGAVVYFGYPNSHEDNAERAVHAALALVAHVRALHTRGEQLHARIGIATGIVVVGELVNSGAAREQTALGETPNLAARLQALAEPDTIVIADSTRRLVGDLFTYRDLGTVTLKGFEAPMHASEVTGEAPVRSRLAAIDASLQPQDASRDDASATPLIAREQELGLLRDRWQQVNEGQGRVVLLTGDAGIGKSRLVQAFVASVGPQSHYELQFRSSAYHAQSPLYPVIHLLPGVLGWRPADTETAKRERLQAFCARLRLSVSEELPLLASLLSLPASSDHPLPPMSAERQKQRTLQALLRTALALAAERPLLMVVEDLHWIDPTTMELLTLLTEQIPTVQAFALFTARLEFRPPWPAHSHVTSLMLTRLTRRQTEELVGRVAGAKALPDEVVAQIVAKTDGVPLFVEELTKMVLECGLVRAGTERYERTGPLPALAIPATLQDSLTARLDRLASAKPIAQLGAMLGREFSHALLKAVSTLDEATLQRELARLVAAEFLYERGAQPDTVYIFKHALIQDAAYQSLLRSTRREQHERIAQVLTERFGSEVEAHPELVAMHYTEGGNAEQAAQWWQKAGQRAFQRASYAEAIAHYVEGLGALESMPRSQARDQAEVALQVELGYALIPVKGWAATESARAFTRAGELCRQAGDTPKPFRALWGLGAFHFVRSDQRRAREVADQCLAVARRTDDAEALIEAHYLCGIVSCVAGDFVRGRADLERCIALHGPEQRTVHRLLYGQDAKASALGWLAMALWTLGYPDDALARARESLAWVRDIPQPFVRARSLASVGFVQVFRGEPQGADSVLQAALAICVEQGYTYFHAVVSAFRGADLVLAGRANEGIAQMQASTEALRKVGSELLLTIVHAHLASAHHALGQVDAGLRAVDGGLRCVHDNGEHWAESELHRIRGALLVLLGPEEWSTAEASLRTALEVATRQQARSYRLRAVRDLAHLLEQRGRHEESKALLGEALREWPDRVDTADLRAARQALQRLLQQPGLVRKP